MQQRFLGKGGVPEGRGIMKKKKAVGWYGKDKRKRDKRAGNDTKELLAEYEASTIDADAAKEDEEYIVEYRDSHKTEEYNQEEYVDEEYEEQEYEEAYEDEEYEEQEYETESYEEDYEIQEYNIEESEEYEEDDIIEESEEYEEDDIIEESEEYEEDDIIEECETQEYEQGEYETEEYTTELYEEGEYEVDEYDAKVDEEDALVYEEENYDLETYEIESDEEDCESEEYEEDYETQTYGPEVYEIENDEESYELSDEMTLNQRADTKESQDKNLEYEDSEYETRTYKTQEYEQEHDEEQACEIDEYEEEYYESQDNFEEEFYDSEEMLETSSEYTQELQEMESDVETVQEYDEKFEDSYEEEEYYETQEYVDEYDDAQNFEASYDEMEEYDEEDWEDFDDEEPQKPVQVLLWRIRDWFSNLTALDAILVSTGVVLVAAVTVILSMFIQNNHVNDQIAAIAPLGSELSNIGIVGKEGLLAMADAALLGNFVEEESTQEISSIEVIEEEPTSSKVNVSFVSVEKDLKIRFTDANTGELITGTAFEVTLTNAKGKNLVLIDEDMDGVIYAQNVNAGVFDAIVTSTDKYKFPTVSQQVTVKDKVEYVVINVQDEVKTEKQIDVAVEDTGKNDAAKEEVKLTDTVEWVESTKTPVGGSESYLLVDKTTIEDPSKTSKAAARILFDTLNVSLEPSSVTLNVGASTALKGTSFENSTEGNIEYQYTTQWKSSNEGVASVSDGTVTAKAEGTAIITYTVTKKTITTTEESVGEETLEASTITIEEYDKLSEEEKKKCEPIKDENDQITGYKYTQIKEAEKEKKTTETIETASAECEVKVEAAKITSGSLELSKSADSCAVGGSLTISPSKLVYTKQDGSTQTITESFPSITWESSDQSIATVDTNGKVTGVKAGKATITGKVTGVKGADDKELAISSSVEITITEAAELTITLDKTKDVTVSVGATTPLVATVSNYKSDSGVTWESSDQKVATVDEKGVVTGVAPGSVTITATTKEKNNAGNQLKATCVVTVNASAVSDTTTKLKDKNGNQIYIKASDGSYKEAVYADYFNNSDFYIKTDAQYTYTGWQTIDGKTYYYDKSGKPVTGTQIIQGVTYNFGSDGAIATAVNGTTFGIDVSRHNGTIDWNAVKASGVDYVIIRCGYRGSSTGVLIEDQNFRTNIKGATAAGLKVGVYVFSQAVNEVEAVKEASLAVSLVKGYNLTYPIFIDTESSGGRGDKIDKATRTAVVNAFCQTVASAGYKAGIYASKSWYEDKLNMGAIGNYKIWLAQYTAAPTYSGKYDMWQYSSKGKINGIKGDVDLNYSYLGY